MVIYKRVVCEVAVLAAVLAVASGTLVFNSTGYFDLRQNGTDNVRVYVDGILVAIAPADADEFLDYMNPPDAEDIADILKPLLPKTSTAKPEASESKPDFEKPAETPLSDVSLKSDTTPHKKETSVEKSEKIRRLTHRLANALIPLLKKHVNTEA